MFDPAGKFPGVI